MLLRFELLNWLCYRRDRVSGGVIFPRLALADVRGIQRRQGFLRLEVCYMLLLVPCDNHQ
jgi:hypothetical protein